MSKGDIETQETIINEILISRQAEGIQRGPTASPDDLENIASLVKQANAMFAPIEKGDALKLYGHIIETAAFLLEWAELMRLGEDLWDTCRLKD